MPVDYFPTIPESSSVLGVLRSETGLEQLGPAYIQVDRVIRVVGRQSTVYLTARQLQMLHICFLEGDEDYALAQRKVEGTFLFCF